VARRSTRPPAALLVPYIENPDEAARAVAAVRYPPRGVRGVAAGQPPGRCRSCWPVRDGRSVRFNVTFGNCARSSTPSSPIRSDKQDAMPNAPHPISLFGRHVVHGAGGSGRSRAVGSFRRNNVRQDDGPPPKAHPRKSPGNAFAPFLSRDAVEAGGQQHVLVARERAELSPL
jgi:hypothetical protein